MDSKTIIIATIGPASENIETIKEMAKNKVDMFRLNFSWGTHDWHLGLMNKIREVSKIVGKNIPIMQDLSGPRVSDENGHHFGGEENVDSVTEKDIDDLIFGIENNVEYIAMSFVGSARDVIRARDIIKERGGNQKIIAKIERKIAVSNLEEIIKESDGVIVARGDLGNEYPLEEIPFIQHKIINKANELSKPVFLATQMLYSMVENKTPTRAEVSDVAYAIIDGADGLLVSDETAKGKNPIETVLFLEKIALKAEEYKNNILIG